MLEEVNFYDLKCVHVVKVNATTGKKLDDDYISWNRFQKSYIEERWETERRYHKIYTIFGTGHELTTLKMPWGDKERITFDFPTTEKEAIERDKNYREKAKRELKEWEQSIKANATKKVRK